MLYLCNDLLSKGTCRDHMNSCVSFYWFMTLAQEHIHHIMGSELRDQKEDMQKTIDAMTKVS